MSPKIYLFHKLRITFQDIKVCICLFKIEVNQIKGLGASHNLTFDEDQLCQDDPSQVESRNRGTGREREEGRKEQEDGLKKDNIK